MHSRQIMRPESTPRPAETRLPGTFVRPRTCLLIPCVILLLSSITPPQASAQGLFRRLRERLGPVLAPPPSESTDANNRSTLPARPLPQPSLSQQASPQRPLTGSSLQAGDAGGGPAARYRSLASPLQRVAPLSGGAASGGGALSPGGNLNPAFQSPTLPPLGRSILSPRSIDSLRESSGNDGPSMGIRAVDANPGYPAVQVTEILPISRADEAGLRVGDFIFAINGVPTPNAAALAGLVAQQRGDQPVRLRLGREGNVFDLEVPLIGGQMPTNAEPVPPGGVPLSPITGSPSPLPALPDPPGTDPLGTDQPATGGLRGTGTAADTMLDARPSETAFDAAALEQSIGVAVEEIAGRRGLRVTNVIVGSAADAAGLKSDDRIVSLDGRMIADPTGFQRLVASEREGAIQMRVIRQNRLIDVELDPSAKPVAGASDSQPGSGTQTMNPLPDTKQFGGGGLGAGLGSILGGVFGTKPKPANENPPNELPPPAAVPAESEPSDPLDLESPLPEPAPSNDSSGEGAQALKDEIQRLREQLKTLESQLPE